MENMALWHERDISHSSVERVIGPDSTILIDYMLKRLSRIIKNLVVYPDRMLENLNRLRGLIFSQQILMRLAALGLKRETAYEMVQRNALKVWDANKDFKTLLLEDEEITGYLTEDELEEIFNIDYHLKHVEDIFERVFT
jgi:adenylosuccinate lyase